MKFDLKQFLNLSTAGILGQVIVVGSCHLYQNI